MSTNYGEVIAYRAGARTLPGPASPISLLNNPPFTNGPRLVLQGTGPWIKNMGGTNIPFHDGTVNVMLVGNARGNPYQGIFTGPYGDCIVVGIMERPAGAQECSRVSLAHLMGGQNQWMSQQHLFQGMTAADSVAFIVVKERYHPFQYWNGTHGDKDGISSGVRAVIRILRGWGIAENRTIVYLGVSGGFGVTLDGHFGECDGEPLAPRGGLFHGFRRRPHLIAEQDRTVQ